MPKKPERPIEPLLWMLFSGGGMASAMLMPALLFLFGLAIPLGWIAAPSYEHLRAIFLNPITRLVLFGVCMLSLFHWAHRFKYTLYDGLQVKHRIGRATACLQLTNVLFPEGLVQQFYAKFELPSGEYVARGTCTVSSNSVPQPFIILAGCTMKIVSGPSDSQGGLFTSASIFNPLRRPGFSTGSTWTLHEYFTGPRRPQHDDDEDD